jgi:hypothetical protein
MTDWDALFGEAALGLDLAQVDRVQGGLRQTPAARSAALALLDSPRDRPAELDVGARPAATTNLDAIFRQEALEFRARGRETPGGVVRLGARWLQWAYRITIVLVVAAVAGMWLIHTGESASGPAVVDGRAGTFAALLPAVVGPDLPDSQGLVIALPGGRSVRATGVHAQLADAAAIEKAGLVPPAQPAILVTGRLDLGASAGSVAPDARIATQVSVVLRSESLGSVLARQVGAMFSDGNTP